VIFDEIWSWFREIDCTPIFLAVPGNHDLQRPTASKSAEKVLENWLNESDVREMFWKAPDDDYHPVV